MKERSNMEIFLNLVVLILVAFQTWYLTKVTDELREARNQIVRMVSTTQSRVKSQKRSGPYPKIPRPKAEQHYENRGAPRPGPGDPPPVTASGTPVRIGKIARRRAGGSTGDSPSD